MINIALRAKRGVKIPTPKQSRVLIVKMFKEQLQLLWVCLTVCLLSYFSFFIISFHLPMYFCILGPHSER